MRVGGSRRAVGGLGGGIGGRPGACQSAHALEVPGAVRTGEKAVMTDSVEAVGQDVREKAADKLVRGEPHDAFAPGAAIILVGERHLAVADGYEPRIGDGGAMGVAGEIVEHALGAAERRLGVDDEGREAE